MSHKKGFESVEYVTDKYTEHFWWIHVIALIWIWEFTLAFHQFVISGAVATWYFARYFLAFKQYRCVYISVECCSVSYLCSVI